MLLLFMFHSLFVSQCNFYQNLFTFFRFSVFITKLSTRTNCSLLKFLLLFCSLPHFIVSQWKILDEKFAWLDATTRLYSRNMFWWPPCGFLLLSLCIQCDTEQRIGKIKGKTRQNGATPVDNSTHLFHFNLLSTLNRNEILFFRRF